MTLWLYRLLFIPALFLLAPHYLLRMWNRGGYRQNFRQRFGAVPRRPRTPGAPRVWLQAVSVGEMLAIGKIVEGLHRAGIEVYLSTTTSTGYRLALERYRDLTIAISYFPLDWLPFVAWAWRRIDPDLMVLTEGERWPEHLRHATKRGVPILCVNARLSDRSFWRLKLFPQLVPVLVHPVTRYLPASHQDAERLIGLGVPKARVTMCGNIKLDVDIPRLADRERGKLRRELGLPPASWVLIGASTWPGEEAALIAALQQSRLERLDCVLLLVPRHAERRSEIERELQSSGFKYHFRSRGPAPEEVDVAVADTTGELRNLLQLSDLVFIGKSLYPHTEGQTPVEAAYLGKPMMFGQTMTNFREIAYELADRQAAMTVHTADELIRMSCDLIRETEQRREMSDRAVRWRAENSGAGERTVEVIRAELAQRGKTGRS